VDTDGRIAPHHLIWPAYWGWLRDETVTPAPLDKVRTASRGILPHAYSLTTSSWPALELAQIGQVLRKLNEQAPNAAVAVYVSGGKLFRSEGDSVTATAHSAAAPVTWPIGHNVRPAQQSLGVRSCQDCHDTEGGMLFGRVAVDGPLVDPNETVAMAQFHGLDPRFNRLFAQSFVFRPWMKLVCGLACVVLLGVLVTFVLRALNAVAQRTSESS
jgi:hypothetical protein